MLFIMTAIFRFSAQTGTESSGISLKVTRFISRIIFRGYKSMTLSQQEFIVSGLHQSLTPGRAMQLKDVMIDSAGAFCGCIAAIVIIAVFLYITDTGRNDSLQNKHSG